MSTAIAGETPGAWRRWLALPTLLLVIAAVVVATRALAVAPGLVPASGKLARAERAMVYELTTAGGPRFRLAGGAEVVQLLVHLELPLASRPSGPGLASRPSGPGLASRPSGPGLASRPSGPGLGGAVAATYRFAVVATLRGPDGAALWERTVTQRARQTKEGERVGGWDYEAAFVVDGRVELADAASVELALPDVPPGSALELRLAAETGELVGGEVRAFARPTALMRAYRRHAVDPAERELRRMALVDDGERRLPETYLPWYALAPEQQEQRLALAWERLAAEGRAGVDYRVRSIYVAPPRPPVSEPTGVPALVVGAGQPLVVQLAGPGTVWVDAWAAGGVPAGPAVVRARLTPRGLAPGSRGVRSDVPGDRSAGPGDRSGAAGEGASGGSGDGSGAGRVDAAAVVQEVSVVPAGRAEISVPDGWWSLELATDLPAAMIQVRADAPERHAGAEDHSLHAGGVGPGGIAGEGALVPVDVRTLQVYALGPEVAALPVALAPGEDPEARFVRVQVRAWGTLAPVTMRYEFVDAQGAVLAAGDHAADTTTAAPFERLRAHEDVSGDRLRAPLVFPLGEAPVSEAAAVGLIAPAGATELRIMTDAPALVAVHGRLPAAEIADGPRWTWPYDQLTDPLVRWRYAPLARPRTFPRRAEDHAARAAAGQVRTILAQVRAEPVRVEEGADGPWRAEQPRGAHARLRLLEEVMPARRKEALAAWGPGSYTRLRNGATTTLDLTRGLPRPPALRYQVTGSAIDVVGAALAVAIDGERTRWPVTSRAGRLGLPRRAQAAVSWLGPGSLAVLANRPPTDGGGQLYEHRQVHALSTGGLAVSLVKPGTAPVGMNVVVYWLDGEPREATKLTLEVDEGRPGRRLGTPVTGVLAGRRTISVRPDRRAGAIFADRRGEGEVAIGRAAVVLGDDVAAGRHTLRVRHAGGPAVWVRFFQAGKAEVRRGAWQWGERRAAVVEEADEDE